VKISKSVVLAALPLLLTVSACGGSGEAEAEYYSAMVEPMTAIMLDGTSMEDVATLCTFKVIALNQLEQQVPDPLPDNFLALAAADVDSESEASLEVVGIYLAMDEAGVVADRALWIGAMSDAMNSVCGDS
jgi:hypothetical protein